MAKTSTEGSRGGRTPLSDLPAGRFQTLQKIDQGGALQARRLASGGIQFYWRYTSDGKTDRVAIGTYDPSAAPKSLSPTAKGYSIAAAAEDCRMRARIHQEKQLTGGYRGHVESVKKTHTEARAREQRANDQTLIKLLETYCIHLEKSGRRSFSDARSIFKLHVLEAWPALAEGPAGGITPEQVTDMLRRLNNEGKGRTANKLRAYMRAAYQCGLDVNSLASIPATFKPFQIASNPAALTKRDASMDKADKNPLTAAELRAYWKLLKPIKGVQGAALRLHLLTGGQRIEQLTKLLNVNVTPNEITLFDGKGRPGQGPRKHTIPLLPLARDALRLLRNDGVYRLSTDNGKTHINAMTMANWAKAIAARIPNFQLKRIRSGVETALATAGVFREIRGQLQSHGLSGIQARHYDAYDYMREKRSALEALMAILEPTKR